MTTRREVVSGLSGWTLPAHVDLLWRWPPVSAPFAEAETSASRGTVHGNLNLVTQDGLIREVTGQGGYRF